MPDGIALVGLVAAGSIVGNLVARHTIMPLFSRWFPSADKIALDSALEAWARCRETLDILQSTDVVKALEFYANPETWAPNPPMSDEYGANAPDAWDDQGEIAREALGR